MNGQQQQVRGRRRAVRPLPPALMLRRECRERERDKFAGSKWGAAPCATALPPPPTHWRRDGRCWPEADPTLALKMLLNVTVSV